MRLGAWVTLSILAQSLAFSQPMYKVTDMGAAFSPLKVSPNGIAAGNGPRAMAWDAEHGLTSIPGFTYARAASAQDVNTSGLVVGYDFQLLSNGSSSRRAFVWDRQNGTREVADFGTYSNGEKVQSEAYGINDLGQIVGRWDRDGGLQWGAFLYTPGQGWLDLPRLHPDKSVQALSNQQRRPSDRLLRALHQQHPHPGNRTARSSSWGSS